MNAKNIYEPRRDPKADNPPKACILGGNETTTHRHDDQEAGLTKIRALS